MVEVLKIIYDAVAYCVKATAELFWIGLKWLLYDVPLYIKVNYGEENYTNRLFEPAVEDIQEPPVAQTAGAIGQVKAQALSKTGYENSGAADESETANIDMFIDALNQSRNKAA